MTIDYTKVFKTSTNIINPNDLSNYYSGGIVRNEMMAGGSLRSATSMPMLNTPVGVSKDNYMLNGSFLSFLEAGIVSVLGIINSYENIANTLNNESVEINVVRITIDVTTPSGATVYSSSSERELSGDSSSFVSNGTLRDTMNAWNNAVDLTRLDSPYAVAMTMYNLTTNKEVTVESMIGGAVLGTVTQQFKNLALKSVAELIGITSITPSVIVGAYIFDMVATELVEMALGLDSQFGYGGDIVGVDKFGNAHYAEIEGSFIDRTTSQIEDFFGEIVGFFSGDGYTSRSEFAETKAKAELRNANWGYDELQNLADLGYTDYGTGYQALQDKLKGTTTWAGFKDLEAQAELEQQKADEAYQDMLNDSGGEGGSDGGFGSSNNPSGGYGASGWGGDTGAFGGGM